MRAVRKLQDGVGNVALTEMPIPQPKQGEVRIRVMAAGVCGTDVKILHGDTWSNPPVTLGHEYSGVVDAVGERVSSIQVGDRVVSETGQVICGQCSYCKTGHQLMCEKRLSIGYGVDGAFADFIVVREDIVHKIPQALPFDQAALCEPFAVALHGVWDSGAILPTDTVLVTGPGAIGQLAAQAAKAKGATVILAGTPNDKQRLELARQMGVDKTIDHLDPAELFALTGGKGVDVAIDCTGAQPAIRAAMQSLKRTGRMVQIGLTRPTMEIDYALFTGRELTLSGSFGHQWHNWEQAIALMSSGKVDVSRLITGHYPLESWEQAFADMEHQRGVKILIHPNQTAE